MVMITMIFYFDRNRNIQERGSYKAYSLSAPWPSK